MAGALLLRRAAMLSLCCKSSSCCSGLQVPAAGVPVSGAGCRPLVVFAGRQLQEPWRRQQHLVRCTHQSSSSSKPSSTTGTASPGDCETAAPGAAEVVEPVQSHAHAHADQHHHQHQHCAAPTSAWQSADPLASASNPKVFLGGAAVFSATAYDVFHPNSLQVLPFLDASLHQYAHSLNTFWRLFFADIVLSDTWIVLGMLAWVGATVACAVSKKPEAAATVALSWLFYAFGAGPLQYDPWAVDILKHMFERLRPSPIHHSFSFPSGHTSSTSFLVGAALFVLLPVVLGRRRVQGPQAQAPSAFLPRLINRVEGHWGVWALACATTASGRVLADAHWLSDTVAATALGVSLVSALAAVVRPIVVHVRARQHLAQAIQAAPDGLSSDQSRLQPSQVVLVPPKAAKVVRSEEMHMQQQGEAGQGQQEGAHKAGDGGG